MLTIAAGDGAAMEHHPDLSRELGELRAELRGLAATVASLEAAMKNVLDYVARQQAAAEERHRLRRLGAGAAVLLLSIGGAATSFLLWIAERWDRILLLFRNGRGP